MSSGKHWAGVLAREEGLRLPDPHPASVRIEVNGVTFCCSVLPWPLAASEPPWSGEQPSERMASAVSQIVPSLKGRSAVWGGDWNQPLTGNIAGFSLRLKRPLPTLFGTSG